MTKTIIDFRTANTIDHLALMLSAPVELLQQKVDNDNPKYTIPNVKILPFDSALGKVDFLNKNNLESEDYIRTVFNKIEIPKKNKHRKSGKRIVWEIYRLPYEEFYKNLNIRLTDFACKYVSNFPHKSAYGYLRGKNILENAQLHCKASQILHADIRNFFPSISAERVRDMFLGIGIKENIAIILSKILTIEGSLALGLHTSPLVSNLICMKLDDDFDALAEKYGCKYSRYADDITISGTMLPSRTEVENILQENDFALAYDKFRITKPGWHNFVTGLSVDTETPRVPKRMKRKLRQELYYCDKYGVQEHIERTIEDGQYYVQKNINRIDGTVKYISYFERKFHTDMEDLWAAIKTEQKISPRYINQGHLEKRIILCIDETEIECPITKRKFLVIGATSVFEHDAKRISHKFAELFNKYQQSPFEVIDKDALAKKGLHYTDGSEDLRKEYSRTIATECFKTYIGYKELTDSNLYKDTYLEILYNLMNDRFLNTQDGVLLVVVENNPQVPNEIIQDTIYRASSHRYPFLIKNTDKTCVLLSIADFMLGYFRGYVLKDNEPSILLQERRRALFEQIRNKYKIIKNLSDNKVFSRRRPFIGEL